jgi:uncharacterized protein YbcI
VLACSTDHVRRLRSRRLGGIRNLAPTRQSGYVVALDQGDTLSDASTADGPVPVGEAAVPTLSGGRLLSAISNSIVGLVREYYGRGPMKAKTYALDDIIMVVLRDSGYSPMEKTLMDAGEPEGVVAMREDFQRLMAQRYKDTIERLTDRKVVAFISQAHVEPDVTLEVFFIDRPLDGCGPLETIAP